MKKLFFILFVFTTISSTAHHLETPGSDSVDYQEILDYLVEADSLNKALDYKKGEIIIGDDLALINVPEDFKYLNAQETNKILVEAWGNPPRETLGMIFPDSVNPYGFDGWGVVITYNEDGYVEDDEAQNIDYDELLAGMQSDLKEANKERARQGYGTYKLIGWAEPPHYDSREHKLFWALDLDFGDDEERTLNYNVRILGRKGVLILNAVSGMSQIAEVKESMNDVMAFVDFQEGGRYSDFNPGVDKVAAYGIGGLIAGKMAAKAGFFKVISVFLLKTWKFILIGLVAIGGFLRKVFFGDKKERREIGS